MLLNSRHARTLSDLSVVVVVAVVVVGLIEPPRV